MIFFTAQTTDATSATWQIGDLSQNRQYKPFTLLVSGTMGGCTVDMQVSNDGVNWIDGYKTTSTVSILFESTALFARCNITSSSGTTSVTVELT